jgi:two-component system sensor histidine kinase PilS (NtrC family)
MEWLRKGDYGDLSGRIKWLMILRVMVVTFMLGVTVLLHLREGTEFFSTPLRDLYLFIGIFYFLTIVYSLLFSRGVDPSRFAVFQVGVDLVLISGIVLITGGVESLFSIVYFLSIIGASILFYRVGSFTAAGASAIFYGVASWLPFSTKVSTLVDYEGIYLSLSRTEVGYRILLTSFGFFLVAFLTSYLAESLQRAGEELSAKNTHLAELERRSENILQNISSGLVTTDLEGQITYFNRAAERISQVPAGVALGSTLMEVFQLKEGWDPYANLQRLEGSPLRTEGSLRGRPEEILFGMTFSSLRDEDGKLSGVICSFQDLTHIKRMEDQIRRSDRLAVIGELAAGMAHEIRNPLASLSGSVHLLREELVLEETSRELMDIVNREVTRLNSIITDFLNFASPRPLQLQEVDLHRYLQETATLLRQSHSPGCRIEVVAREGENFLAEVDPQMMKQVFWNLSLNATEAMPEGGLLRLTLERLPVEGGSRSGVDCLQITFADTGVGITQKEMEKVFTPFHSTKENGTGLGLAIVFKIVEAHRGRVEIESQVGEGTTFRVKVPSRQGVTALTPLSSGELV